MIIDSHCHLAGEEFAADLDDVVARATAAEVAEALCIIDSGDDAEVGRSAEVRRAWPSVRFATGIHPHNARRIPDVDAAVDTVSFACEPTLPLVSTPATAYS